MKVLHYCRLLFCVLLLLIIPLALTSDAALIDNGDGTITDTDTNLMWLQDVNFAGVTMNWNNAMTWANNLVFAGHNDWRLPSALNQDGSGPCSGHNCTDSEMGHLFYIELGNTISSPLNVGPLINLDQDYGRSMIFWLSQNNWVFNTSTGGSQFKQSFSGDNFAWAVRNMLPEEIDDDGDGFSENQGDCNDADSAIHPNALETPDDGIDQDCNGYEIVDLGTLGGANSAAYGINSLGQIVGSSRTATNKDHAFLYDAGIMLDLGAISDDTSVDLPPILVTLPQLDLEPPHEA